MTQRNGIPETVQTVFPIWIPTTGDSPPQLSVGEGFLENGKLVINFKESLPAIAIQRMIGRGVFLGLSFVMLEDETEEKSEELRSVAGQPIVGVSESIISVSEPVRSVAEPIISVSETIVSVEEPSS